MHLYRNQHRLGYMERDLMKNSLEVNVSKTKEWELFFSLAKLRNPSYN